MADRAYHASWANRYDDEIDARIATNAAVALVLDPDFIVHPTERIGAPPPRRRGRIARAGLFILAAAAAGWGALASEAMWRPWVAGHLGDVLARIESPQTAETAPAAPTIPIAPPAPEPPPVEPPVTREIADVPGADAGLPVANDTKPRSEPLADAGADAPPALAPDATPTPLPEPKFDPADPFQKRAFEAGLHPELSRALLSRLSKEDYRNAALAVSKAMTEASDDEKFFWPRRSTPDQALFRVHFVVGAAPDCRRYIVTVSKDGWSTTAQPMEKCGIKKPGRGAT